MVSGDAYVRVRRQRRSSAGPCADRRRPGQRCSTWDDIAREADKFPPIVRGDQPFAQSVIWRDRAMSLEKGSRDRQSVVKGTSGSVGLDRCGRRIIEKKKT